MKIEFSTEFAAFDEYGICEIFRILDEIKIRVQAGHTSGTIMDINGNKIGSWTLETKQYY